jgi:hypothetical protein
VTHSLGSFWTKEEAAAKYDQTAIDLQGTNAVCNYDTPEEAARIVMIAVENYNKNNNNPHLGPDQNPKSPTTVHLVGSAQSYHDVAHLETNNTGGRGRAWEPEEGEALAMCVKEIEPPTSACEEKLFSQPQHSDENENAVGGDAKDGCTDKYDGIIQQIAARLGTDPSTITINGSAGSTMATGANDTGATADAAGAATPAAASETTSAIPAAYTGTGKEPRDQSGSRCPPQMVKPCAITTTTGRWTTREHADFVEAMERYP